MKYSSVYVGNCKNSPDGVSIWILGARGLREPRDDTLVVEPRAGTLLPGSSSEDFFGGRAGLGSRDSSEGGGDIDMLGDALGEVGTWSRPAERPSPWLTGGSRG